MAPSPTADATRLMLSCATPITVLVSTGAMAQDKFQ